MRKRKKAKNEKSDTRVVALVHCKGETRWYTQFSMLQELFSPLAYASSSFTNPNENIHSFSLFIWLADSNNDPQKSLFELELSHFLIFNLDAEWITNPNLVSYSFLKIIRTKLQKFSSFSTRAISNDRFLLALFSETGQKFTVHEITLKRSNSVFSHDEILLNRWRI